MSRTDLRCLFAIAAAAFALRAGAAVLTEFKPIFPAYYYMDSEFADREARADLAAESRDESRGTLYPLGQRTHIFFTKSLYRLVGPRPPAPKLVNALASALGVLAFGVWAVGTFSPRVGMLAATALALWPSHIFYTSQNFKEGLICGALMGAFLLIGPGEDLLRRALGGLALLVVLVGLRTPVAAVALAAIAAPWAWKRLWKLPRTALAALALVMIAAAMLRWAPAEITAMRDRRQYSERLYAAGHGRDIGTLLFPDESLSSWLDVAAFVPKASFHVLFMPLPGLYPMGGKPGRYLAAAENVGLLLLCALGLIAAARGGFAPARLSPLLFFAAMTAASSLLEFDLGGASRHKLMYLPMLFPFAAEEALRLALSRRNA